MTGDPSVTHAMAAVAGIWLKIRVTSYSLRLLQV